MNKKERIEHLKIAGNALVAFVPYIGSSVNSLISDYQAKRKHERLTKFCTSLKADIEYLHDKINKAYVDSEDFLDIFEETSNKIANERTEEKRLAYKNILVSSIISKEIDYDYTEETLRLLERLRPEHLFFLNLFNNPHEINKQRGNPLGNGGGFSTSINQLISKLLPEWSEEKILDICTDLENERLLANVSSSYKAMMTDQGIHHLENKLTTKGKRFYSYISTSE